MWESVNCEGPSLCFHAGSVVRDCFYIHGGVTSRLSSEASFQLWKFDFSSLNWSSITSSGAPNCSHHVAVTQHDRYLILIGGWNGKSRTSDVHVFDCVDETWHHTRTIGFPEGAGLSSHTATSLRDGNFIVTGREGGLRTQRRAGSTFKLSGDASRRGCSFQYLDTSMGIASRSGHTACPMTQGRLALLGGRSDHLLEYLVKVPVTIDVHPKIVEKLSCLCTGLRPCPKPPGGRRNHVSVSVGEMVVMHGGETFDGKAKAAVFDVWVMDVRGGGLKWLKVGQGVGDVARAGHVVCVARDNIFIHGGFDESGRTRNEVMKLS
ncbi:kelch domain-containing protein 9-like [Corticium candelabrum]|uniref:kelch domain-containing protein 9-like n=1 Tax=Corticium candelabrum TaxID=121492 RepID=UPI002E267645|nr:kelch domain-containing protein 9-like [Corticium candelabrum]